MEVNSLFNAILTKNFDFGKNKVFLMISMSKESKDFIFWQNVPIIIRILQGFFVFGKTYLKVVNFFLIDMTKFKTLKDFLSCGNIYLKM